MSEAQTTQTAVDTTKTSAEPDVAADSARNDGDELDKLLSEFDSSKTTTSPATAQPEQKTGAANDLAKLVAEQVSREIQTHSRKEKIEKDYNFLIDKVHEDTKASPRLIRGFVEDFGKENPKLADAYFGAKTDAARAKVISAVIREFRKEAKTLAIDESATADREAVTAAVRGASTKAPPDTPPDLSKMSNAQFEAEKDRLFGG